MTVRQAILENVRQTLEGVTALKTVLLQPFRYVDVGRMALPAAFCWVEEATKQAEVNQYEQWQMTIGIYIWGNEKDMEDVLGKVHQSLMQDRRRGGYAMDTQVVASELVDLDPELGLGSVVLRTKVVYRHLCGNPYQQ